MTEQTVAKFFNELNKSLQKERFERAFDENWNVFINQLKEAIAKFQNSNKTQLDIHNLHDDLVNVLAKYDYGKIFLMTNNITPRLSGGVKQPDSKPVDSIQNSVEELVKTVEKKRTVK